MRVVDCHVHVKAEADPKELVERMDANKQQRILADTADDVFGPRG